MHRLVVVVGSVLLSHSRPSRSSRREKKRSTECRGGSDPSMDDLGPCRCVSDTLGEVQPSSLSPHTLPRSAACAFGSTTLQSPSHASVHRPSAAPLRPHLALRSTAKHATEFKHHSLVALEFMVLPRESSMLPVTLALRLRPVWQWAAFSLSMSQAPLSLCKRNLSRHHFPMSIVPPSPLSSSHSSTILVYDLSPLLVQSLIKDPPPERICPSCSTPTIQPHSFDTLSSTVSYLEHSAT